MSLNQTVLDYALQSSYKLDRAGALNELNAIAASRLPTEADLFTLFGKYCLGPKDDEARREDLIMIVRETAEYEDDYIDEKAMVDDLFRVKNWRPTPLDLACLTITHSIGHKKPCIHQFCWNKNEPTVYTCIKCQWECYG
jgi:hypothetical protein